MGRRRTIAAVAAAAALAGAAWTADAGWEAQAAWARATAPDAGWVEHRPGTTWEHCDVDVVVNIPEQLRDDVELALTALAEASGLRLRIVGTTGRTPTTTWAHDGIRTGGEHPAVAIAYAPADTTDIVRPGDLAGAVANPAAGRYVTGAVVITPDGLARHGDGTPGLQQLLLHELGHLAGLGHAGVGTVMHAHVDGSVTGYTGADREGFARSVRCGLKDSDD